MRYFIHKWKEVTSHVQPRYLQMHRIYMRTVLIFWTHLTYPANHFSFIHSSMVKLILRKILHHCKTKVILDVAQKELICSLSFMSSTRPSQDHIVSPSLHRGFFSALAVVTINLVYMNPCKFENLQVTSLSILLILQSLHFPFVFLVYWWCCSINLIIFVFN